VLFLLLGAAAGLATTLPVWASFLIVAGGLAMVAAIVGYVAVTLLKKGAPPTPDLAIEEARRTKEAVQRT
jgi:purine-cytosine permease-like protein